MSFSASSLMPDGAAEGDGLSSIRRSAGAMIGGGREQGGHAIRSDAGQRVRAEDDFLAENKATHVCP